MSDPFQTAIDALAHLGCKPKQQGDSYTACCPCHEADGGSHTPSLSVKRGDKQPVLVYCHAGCNSIDILKALGVESAAPRTQSKREIVATYSYRSADGTEVRQKLRFDPKSFQIRHQGADKKWVYKGGAGPAVLYNLPEVREAIQQGQTIVIVEGEKDADRLAELGWAATTSIEGAARPNQKATWRREYTEQLSGAKRVILLPDNDPPGQAHMQHIAAQLVGKVGELITLELPGLPYKGDVSKWLDAGNSPDDLRLRIETATTPIEVAPDDDGLDPRIVIHQAAKSAKPKRIPHSTMAGMLNDSVFKSNWKYNPVSMEWYEYRHELGIFERRTIPAVKRAVYAAIKKLSQQGFDASYVNGVTDCLLNEAGFIDSPNNRDKVCFQNGVLDLNTRELLPHSAEYGFTAAMPYSWEPNAPDPKPVIDWMREAVGGHEDQVQLLRAYLNAIVVGRSDLQRYLELVGPGGSGKGTFTRLAQALVGVHLMHSTAIKQLEENNRFESARLFGKKLVVVTDAEKWRGDISMLKSITGQDAIRFEEKHKQAGESFTFEGMVLIAANQNLESTDYSSGIQRRRITLNLDHVVPASHRRDLEAEFRPLLPAVMRWALDMPRSEVTSYLRDTSSRVPSLKQTRLDTLAATNPLAAFAMDCLRYDPNQSTQVGVKKRFVETVTSGSGTSESHERFLNADRWLYPAYVVWCAEHGKLPIANNSLASQLIDVCKNMLGWSDVERVKDRGGARIKGVVLKGDCDELVMNCDEHVTRQTIDSDKLYELSYKTNFVNENADDRVLTETGGEHETAGETKHGGKGDEPCKVRNVHHNQQVSSSQVHHQSVTSSSPPPNLEAMRELLLPQRLAQSAGLDEAALMAGQLAGEDWAKLTNGAADLSRCLRPEQRPMLDALVSWIWKSSSPEAVPAAPAPLSREAVRVGCALIGREGLHVDDIQKLTHPRMTRNDLANALSELARTGRAAEIEGKWFLRRREVQA